MNNLSKIVLTADGKKIGYVLDVAVDFDTMQKSGYYVVDEESEGEFLLRLQDILCVSESFLLIEDESRLEFVTERKTIFGKQLLGEKAEDFGRLQSLVFGKNKCEKFVTDKAEVASRFVKSVGDDFIMLRLKKRKKNAAKFDFNFSNLDGVVEIQGAQYLREKVPVSAPEKISLSAKYYVGKICTQDILGYNNEKIVGKGEVVTKSVVEKAKKHNKLNHLFFAVKK